MRPSTTLPTSLRATSGGFLVQALAQPPRTRRTLDPVRAFAC